MEPLRSDPKNEIERPADTPFDLVTVRHQGQKTGDSDAESLGYAPGRVIAAKYKLLRLLGQGGMCTVWAVQNIVLDAQFALKLIRNDGGEEHAAERMLREARAAARIEHPAIIRVFDFGTTPEGDPFLVMELLTGVSVRDRLRIEGVFSPTEAVRLLLPIAEALAVAHSHGVVHRDLKPDNIVCVEQEGGKIQPKLIDFGIAKQIEEERITQTGMVLGSAEYMSPEQALGLVDVDQRTDIWSFSVALFEMLTGTTPFLRHGELATILQAVVEEPVPPMSRFGVHEPELWSIISRGLRKAPGDRWEDMHSLGVALAGWLVRHGVDEDACMQSVRMVWLGNTPSTAPVTTDVPSAALPKFPPPSTPLLGPRRPSRAQARLAELSEAYEIPKKSMWRTMLGVAAAAGTIAIIATAGLYASHARQQPTAPPAAPNKASPRSLPVEPAPPPPPAEPAEPPSAPAAGTEAPRSEKETKKETPPAASTQPEPPPKSEKRHTRRAPKTSPAFASPRPGWSSEPLERTEPKWPAEPSLPNKPSFEGTTPLPDVKPPPEFSARPPPPTHEKPDQSNGAGGESDNPYVDEEEK